MTDDQIHRSIRYLDPDRADPEAYATSEEFLAAVLCRSPQALRDILNPCEDCIAFEKELARVERHNKLLRSALFGAAAMLTATVVWAAFR